MMHIISLGAGVQSSTMALMAAHGEITVGWIVRETDEYVSLASHWAPESDRRRVAWTGVT